VLKVKIKDFQSVADTEFEIDGFTVIVGKNNRGKSAIVRAIDSALSNRLGNNFIRWGKLQTEVNLVKDDLDISWVKGETASYNINKKPYTSLNRAVPKPITDAGFKKFEIADEKLNPLIAHQFEELFLINRSGPFVTEALSTLYDLNDINDADALCQKKLKASKNLLKTRLIDAESLTEKIKKFNGIDEIKHQWKGIKNLNEKSIILKKDISEIEQFIINVESKTTLVNKLKKVINLKISDIKNLENLIIEYNWIKDIQHKFEASTETVQKLQKVSELKIPELEKLSQSINDFDWLNETIEIFHKALQTVQSLKEIPLLKIPDTQKLNTLIHENSIIDSLLQKFKETVLSCDRCKTVLFEFQKLDEISEKIKNIENQVEAVSYLLKIEENFSIEIRTFKELKNSYEKAEKDLITIQTELNSFKVCPLCNTPLTVEHGHE